MPEVSDLQELIRWLEKTVPALMQSKENWKVIINGSKGGELRYEISQTGEILPHRKQRLEERIR